MNRIWLVLLLAQVGVASAETTSTEETPHWLQSTERESSERYVTPVSRDPFATTEVIRQSQQNSSAGIQFLPMASARGLPEMRLKGLVNKGSSKDMAALLEIEGMGVFVVREGDTVGLNAMRRNQSNEVIQIESIKGLSLIVRYGVLGDAGSQRFVVR